MKCDADSDFDVGGWLMVLIMIDGCEEAPRRGWLMMVLIMID